MAVHANPEQHCVCVYQFSAFYLQFFLIMTKNGFLENEEKTLFWALKPPGKQSFSESTLYSPGNKPVGSHEIYLWGGGGFI